ncbi:MULTISPECIES: SGNH/GDSL hydrolase family protein [Pseudomonas]|uniref:SGNH hydrolase-type esterase domain-containing protein n=1 Tax=Pseudomonas flexibilis TaxID=706570 RepID=A0A1N6NBI8_9PSED|nr:MULTISPECIES: SGNH/GDSL hydrolase family protein [Pseudomonas]KHL70930.1 hypothetical protein SF06_03400 [Pseudomonas flexibilis]SCX87709.1 hypothetical protein SAMN02927929_00794 [Pseudomonas flexibilis]SIP89448.1 hypothetical protein SAMN05421672_101217 [Pseudomonas flexibilis]
MRTLAGLTLLVWALSVRGDAVQAPGTDVKWLHGLPSIVCWGDSLTTSSYPHFLAKLTGRTVTNRGVGGNTSAQIAARQGGRPTYVKLTGGKIPSSGTVDVAEFTVVPMTQYGRQQLEGTLGGVRGVLRRHSDTAYTFTRAQAGDAVDAPVALPFLMDIGDTDHEIAVIWAGRNNYDEPQQVISDVRAMVEFLKPLHKRFLVMPPPNADFAHEYIGGRHYADFVAIRDGLREAFPNNFLDIWQLLVESYDPRDPGDVADYRHGIVPRSLRDDRIHLNEKGARLVAEKVRDYLIDFKGY